MRRPNPSEQAERTRQARRLWRLTRAPNGPRMRRLDVLLPRETYEKFEEIMAIEGTRRREALVRVIQAAFERLPPAGRGK